MSVLAGENIRREMKKAPSEDPLILVPLLEESQIGEASVDVRLGYEFIVLRKSSVQHIDPTRTGSWEADLHRYQERTRISLHDKFVIHPGQLILGATLEYISLPRTLAASVEGRSSWGRLGLVIATASTIGPGFKGCITLELVNAGEVPLVLYPGIRIAQIVFHRIEGSAEYKGKYDCPTGPEFTQIHRDTDISIWGGSSG
jgi:dCTP deaminase